ncbi:MAG TPA: hypothetical protein PLD81_05985, partial [Elusimicrobiales bacterium]|nr:hypothetical protein [Elusimicrobiales bacterium]
FVFFAGGLQLEEDDIYKAVVCLLLIISDICGLQLEEDDIYKADCADGKPVKIKEDSPAVYGEDEIVGYVVTLKDDNYIFESYLCESPIVCDHPPSFRKYSYKELNLRMENFLKKFTQ